MQNLIYVVRKNKLLVSILAGCLIGLVVGMITVMVTGYDIVVGPIALVGILTPMVIFRR